MFLEISEGEIVTHRAAMPLTTMISYAPVTGRAIFAGDFKGEMDGEKGYIYKIQMVIKYRH